MTDEPAARGPRTSGAGATGALADLGPGLLVMDVDSTLIDQEVIELLAEHAGAREQVAEITARAMRGELDFAASLRERVAALAGVPRRVLTQVRDEVRLTPGARDLIDSLHARGCRVGVVSGGFEEVVAPMARRLGIDHVAANRLEVSGGEVISSVLSPEVRVNSWSSVRESVLMDGVNVGRNTVVNRAILDKYVVVEEGAMVGIDAEHDRERGFTVTDSGITVVAKGQRVSR